MHVCAHIYIYIYIYLIIANILIESMSVFCGSTLLYCTLSSTRQEGSPTLRSLLILSCFLPLGGLGLGGCHNHLAHNQKVKPFETVSVIKGYTNKIDLSTWVLCCVCETICSVAILSQVPLVKEMFISIGRNLVK